MPEGCVFGHKGPAIFPLRESDHHFILGIANSAVADYVLRGLTSFGSWEVGVIKRLPIPRPTSQQRERIGDFAKTIHDVKATWDQGNEVSTRFYVPWLLSKDLINNTEPLAIRLEQLAQHEAAEQDRIRKLHSELDEQVYKLYGIPETARATIETTLGGRPLEVLWPQMEGKSVEQKRMEHVFRLLSHIVHRIVDADEDGVVPFTSVVGESSLFERVSRALQNLFPKHDVGQVEIEIANELKKTVKGYRRTASIAQWLENAFFEYHCALYKSRPIIWQIASVQGTAPFAFSALIHYHRFDPNGMAKLRGQYLRDAIDHFRREAALADKAGRTDLRIEWQSRLEEAQELDRRLQWIQEGRHEGQEGGDNDFRILTPWKSADQRPKGWDPDLDDGVKVNIQPFQKAGVLRIAKVV